MAAESTLIAGIDLGGTNMQIGVVDTARLTDSPDKPDDAIVGAARKKTNVSDGPDGVLDRIATGVREACKDAGVDLKDLAAIGIGAPGGVDPLSGIVDEAPNLRWEGVHVSGRLRSRLERPVYLDNDVNCALVGEHRAGAGRGETELLGVWVGTGVGGAFILNGSLYHGPLLTAGEIGHTHLFPGAPPGLRTLEQHCSRTAIVDRLNRLIQSNHSSRLTELAKGKNGTIKSSTIAKAYEMHDELTVQVVDHAAFLLGTSIGGIVTLLSLRRVVLGGGLTEALGRPFVNLVQQHTRQAAFPSRCKKVEVLPTVLEDNAGLLGAALLAADRLDDDRYDDGD